jgi:Ca2+-binding RTX toxin-like protein
MTSKANIGIGRRAVLLLAAMVLALLVASGTALAITKDCEAYAECLGTRNADTLNGTEANDRILGSGGADTLNGFGGNDALYGQGGTDELFGGPGTDGLIGGPGPDALSGGADRDFYYFGDGWGKESITDSATSANAVIFRKGPEVGELVPVSEDLTISLISGSGPEATNASGTSTLNWDSQVINDVQSGSGDDRITGNLSANRIVAHTGGADTISAGWGDDFINVADGERNDVVDCGGSVLLPDNDTVLYDAGDVIAANCERR